MNWSDLQNNRGVNGVTLQNAVDTGVFTLKLGQTIPNTNKVLTRDQAFSLVNIDSISGNKLAIKSDFIASVSPGFYTTRIWIGQRTPEYANFSSEDVVGQSKSGSITANSLLVYSTLPLTSGSVVMYTDPGMTTKYNLRSLISDGIRLYVSYEDGSGIASIVDFAGYDVSSMYSFDFTWSGDYIFTDGSTTIWGFTTSPTLVLGLHLNWDTSNASFLYRDFKTYGYSYGGGIVSIT